MVYHFFYEVKETNGHHRVVTRTVRGTRTLRCRPTLLSLRDISPGRGKTCLRRQRIETFFWTPLFFFVFIWFLIWNTAVTIRVALPTDMIKWARAVNWVRCCRCRWQMKAVPEQEETRSNAKRCKRAVRLCFWPRNKEDTLFEAPKNRDVLLDASILFIFCRF